MEVVTAEESWPIKHGTVGCQPRYCKYPCDLSTMQRISLRSNYKPHFTRPKVICYNAWKHWKTDVRGISSAPLYPAVYLAGIQLTSDYELGSPTITAIELSKELQFSNLVDDLDKVRAHARPKLRLCQVSRVM